MQTSAQLFLWFGSANMKKNSLFYSYFLEFSFKCLSWIGKTVINFMFCGLQHAKANYYFSVYNQKKIIEACNSFKSKLFWIRKVIFVLFSLYSVFAEEGGCIGQFEIANYVYILKIIWNCKLYINFKNLHFLEVSLRYFSPFISYHKK